MRAVTGWRLVTRYLLLRLKCVGLCYGLVLRLGWGVGGILRIVGRRVVSVVGVVYTAS